MFAALMFTSKIIMEAFPNIHLLGMLVMLMTVVFREKALIPIYLYVIVQGLFAGFAPWWVPYLYVWTVLWAVAMFLPKKMPPIVAMVVYIAISGLHGLSFGLLYAPSQVLLFFGGNWSMFWPWVISGLPFDLVHCIGNVVVGILILPLVKALTALHRAMPISSGKHAKP